MKAQHANVFVDGAKKVFKQELGVTLTRQSITKKDKPRPGRPVCIVIGITGDMRGQVVYALDHEFAMDIAHQMMPDTLPSVLKKLTASAVGELGNMITGQASIALAGDDKELSLTPPAVFIGRDIVVNFLKMPTISLNMLCEMGVLEINIALSDEGGV